MTRILGKKERIRLMSVEKDYNYQRPIRDQSKTHQGLIGDQYVYSKPIEDQHASLDTDMPDWRPTCLIGDPSGPTCLIGDWHASFKTHQTC